MRCSHPDCDCTAPCSAYSAVRSAHEPDEPTAAEWAEYDDLERDVLERSPLVDPAEVDDLFADFAGAAIVLGSMPALLILGHAVGL